MTNLEQLKSNIKQNLPWKIFILAAAIAFAFYLFYFHKAKPNFTEVKIGSEEQHIIYAQIADTQTERSLGLSFTKMLEENAGMLFIFEEVSQKNFWMRDMNYNLDIIWIDENKTILGFAENADKDSYNPQRPNESRIYRSPENTKYVLELTAGTIQRLKIKSGDVIDFKY